jgi:hypothetical protein
VQGAGSSGWPSLHQRYDWFVQMRLSQQASVGLPIVRDHRSLQEQDVVSGSQGPPQIQ